MISNCKVTFTSFKLWNANKPFFTSKWNKLLAFQPRIINTFALSSKAFLSTRTTRNKEAPFVSLTQTFLFPFQKTSNSNIQFNFFGTSKFFMDFTNFSKYFVHLFLSKRKNQKI